jgi:hypothetical protein
VGGERRGKRKEGEERKRRKDGKGRRKWMGGRGGRGKTIFMKSTSGLLSMSRDRSSLVMTYIG